MSFNVYSFKRFIIKFSFFTFPAIFLVHFLKAYLKKIVGLKKQIVPNLLLNEKTIIGATLDN